jgi:hypothetical protein
MSNKKYSESCTFVTKNISVKNYAARMAFALLHIKITKKSGAKTELREATSAYSKL